MKKKTMIKKTLPLLLASVISFSLLGTVSLFSFAEGETDIPAESQF